MHEVECHLTVCVNAFGICSLLKYSALQFLKDYKLSCGPSMEVYCGYTTQSNLHSTLGSIVHSGVECLHPPVVQCLLPSSLIRVLNAATE